jgi:hypothetical protein
MNNLQLQAQGQINGFMGVIFAMVIIIIFMIAVVNFIH